MRARVKERALCRNGPQRQQQQQRRRRGRKRHQRQRYRPEKKSPGRRSWGPGRPGRPGQPRPEHPGPQRHGRLRGPELWRGFGRELYGARGLLQLWGLVRLQWRRQQQHGPGLTKLVLEPAVPPQILNAVPEVSSAPQPPSLARMHQLSAVLFHTAVGPFPNIFRPVSLSLTFPDCLSQPKISWER